MHNVAIAAFEDELEKIAFYGEIFPKSMSAGVPRAIGRSAKEVIRNIRKKIAPRAPETAARMERGIDAAIKAHPKKGKHVAWRFGPDEDTSATSSKIMQAKYDGQGFDVKSPMFRKIMGAMGMGGKPGQIMSNTTSPSVLAHEMAHIKQNPRIGTEKFLAKNPFADEVDATRTALRSLGKKDDLELSYGLASHHASDSLLARNLKAATDYLPREVIGAKDIPGLKRIGDDPAKMVRVVNAVGRRGTERNIHLLPRMGKDFNDVIRMRRRLSERLVGMKLGPSAEKKMRRDMNKQLSERFLNPELSRPLP